MGLVAALLGGSACDDEYKEACDKAAVLYRNQPDFDIMTIARVSHKQVVDLDEHIKRLKESVRYFAYPFSK